MGERFRLKESFDISGFSPANQVILQALKDYGMIVADNGSGWYISGEPSSRWDDDELSELKTIAGSNFEAVDLTPILTSLGQSSGSAAGGTQVAIHGSNFSGAAGMLEVRFGAAPATSVTVVSDTLVLATSPAHAAGQVDVRVVSPYGTSAIAPAGRFTYQAGSAVVGRFVFYNQSVFDGGGAAAGPSDDAAIAADKSAYLPGSGTATFANITSYTRGVNGIMIDLAGSHGPITAADFAFKTGHTNSPGSWAAAAAPSTIVVRAGAGTSGADRVEILWGANAPKNTWLQVTVKGNDALGGSRTNTGLAASDVFYFGNRMGDTGSGTATSEITSVSDETATRNNTGAGAAISNVFDHDRSGAVSMSDAIAARNNLGTLVKINLPAGPPAPEMETAAGQAQLAFALAVLRPVVQPADWVEARPAANHFAPTGAMAPAAATRTPALVSRDALIAAVADEEPAELAIDEELALALSSERADRS
jgi:hypothetical protein